MKSSLLVMYLSEGETGERWREVVGRERKRVFVRWWVVS